ncbi:MAG: cytochrome c3 family protein, partial [Acidobacteria bacterium]|nr:cytochrome c3 family protein [Acidobacteriota bacterium]
HSTGPVRISPGNILQPAEAGVRCEACHGPGRLHVQAASLGDSRRARALIANPKRSPAQEILVKCGQCHRPPAGAGSTIDWNYSWNVRHQPVYLAQSQCMTKSAGRLSCLTCHDPHNPLKETTAATYRERCLACHDGRSARAVPVKGACRKEGACATCHMPAVSPQPALRFTNHWIGVYDPAKPLRPRNH